MNTTIANEIPRPEYPNPQFQRDNWMNLNGLWEFEFDFGKSGRDRKFYIDGNFTKEIMVPFCPESKLSGIGFTDFIPAVWYKRTVELSDIKGNVFLHFGAVDYKTYVYINGTEVGTHIGGYSSFSFDLSPYVKVGKNEIVVYVEDDLRSGLQPRGKQSSNYYSQGCDYTRTTGIWQTVWLEFLPESYIKNLKYYPDIQNSLLHIQAQLVGVGDFKVKALWNNNICGENSIVKSELTSDTVNISIKLQEVHVWELGKGGLYDLELTFGEDIVTSYFALREVKLCDNKFLLNGKSVFQRTVLDQGFYLDGIYTAKDEMDFVNDIKISMDMGFNGARLHQKVFEPRFLYHCDRMGYMVWGEHGNWGMDLSNPLTLHRFLTEWLEILNRDFNHPAIIGWCPFNETWDYEGRRQIDDIIKVIYQVTKQFDTTRPCIDTSGNFHTITDIYDLHNYTQNVEEFKQCYDDFADGGKIKEPFEDRQHYDYDKKLPLFISEYGGIKLDVENSNQSAWGYGEAPKDATEFLERYKGLTQALLNNKNIMGFCYTQLYDVEQEVNGLYTYSRIPKISPEIIRNINSKPAQIELSN